MERMGPEALLVTSSRSRHSGVAEFARLEYSLADAPRIEGLLLWEMEGLRERRSAAGRLRSWGRALFRRTTRGVEREEPIHSHASGLPTEAAPRWGSPSATNLAALPAIVSATRATREVFPLAAAPVHGRI